MQDYKQLDRETGLRFSGDDEELYMEVISDYCSEKDGYRDSLLQYSKEGNLKDYRVTAHALKGASFLIGATQFGEMAKEMEYAAAEGDLKKIQTETEAFLAVYEEFTKWLETDVL